MQRVQKVYLYRHALWDMAAKQFKAKYAGSRLGIWWAVITPVLLALSINFVFTSVFDINMPNYTFFILAGMIPWIFFSNTLGEVTTSFISNYSLLKQSLFPREFFPISSVFANFLNFLIGLLFLLPLFVVLNYKVLLLLPVLCAVIIFQCVFIIGLGILFSCINVFLRDLNHFLSVGLMIWFWITPVFYSVDAIPASFRWICLLNPMTHYVILYQGILFSAIFPSPFNLMKAALISLCFFSAGYFIFLGKEAALLKRI